MLKQIYLPKNLGCLSLDSGFLELEPTFTVLVLKYPLRPN